MSITWNGVSSDTIGVIVERIPNRYVPTRRFSPQQVAGRNGNILLVDKSFPNVEQEYEVYLSAEAQGLPSVARACAEWLMGPDGYCRLEDSYDTTVYREAFLMGGYDLENILNKFGRCTITFSCKPQKFLYTGLPSITIDPTGDRQAHTGEIVTFEAIDGDNITSITAQFSPIQSTVPTDYQTVEYIESTGTQWIDTGLKANQDTGFSIVYYTNNEVAGTEYGCIFGARKSSANNEYQLTSFSTTSPPQGVFRYGNQTFGTVGMQKNVIQRVSVRNGIIINADGISTTLNTQTFETPVNITLFALNQDGTITQNGKVRIYDIELYDGDALIAHMVPCYRISDNIIGMYDIVRKSFFTNGGTGVFTKGSNVGLPNPYTICPISGRTGLSVYVGPTTAQADATTYAVDWTTEAGTVYGGTLDVVTGLLTVDKAMVDLGTLNWSNAVNTGITRFRAPVAGIKQVSLGTELGHILCSNYEPKTANQTYAGNVGISQQQNTNDVYIYDPQKEELSAADFKTAMNGVQLVYELATPLTYQISPQEVELLVGLNNIWADTNEDITVEVVEPSKLDNPTPFDALPLLTVSGEGAITINDRTILIHEAVEDFDIDCESGEADDNSKIYCMEFPVLHGGQNLITCGSTITSLSLIPRWWTL